MPKNKYKKLRKQLKQSFLNGHEQFPIPIFRGKSISHYEYVNIDNIPEELTFDEKVWQVILRKSNAGMTSECLDTLLCIIYPNYQ